MKKTWTFISVITIVASFSVSLLARTSYVGYSGAPGSRGTCSISCHNMSDFAPTMAVNGFPEYYTPGQQYTITVERTSGSSIAQFNASVRIGSGSVNAGVISAGTGTAVYNHANETNGVHWSSAYRTSGNFIWTAPPAGTGEVRLYFAGLQGNLTSGADTAIVLVSNETATGIEETQFKPTQPALIGNYPNPFNSRTNIEITLEKSDDISLEIYDIAGRMVATLYNGTAGPGKHYFIWDAADMPTGIYFYRFNGKSFSSMGKMVLLK